MVIITLIDQILNDGLQYKTRRHRRFSSFFINQSILQTGSGAFSVLIPFLKTIMEFLSQKTHFLLFFCRVFVVIVFIVCIGSIAPPAGLYTCNQAHARQKTVNCFPGSLTPKLELITLINNWRINQGLSPLAIDPRLEAAAQLHSQDMATNSFCGHIGSNGSPFSQRILAEGYVSPSGELTGCGYPTARSFLNALLADEPHRLILLQVLHRHIGVGLVNNQWTVDFGTANDGPICAGFNRISLTYKTGFLILALINNDVLS